MVEGIKGSKGFSQLGGTDTARGATGGGPAPVAKPGAVGRPQVSGPREPFDLSAVSGARGIARDLAIRPPVDAPRVAALRLAIEAGSYRPDADAIAGAMIAQELQALAARRG